MIIGYEEQLRVLKDFFECQVIKEMIGEMKVADQEFLEHVIFGGPPNDIGKILHREQLIGEARIRRGVISDLKDLVQRLEELCAADDETIANETDEA